MTCAVGIHDQTLSCEDAACDFRDLEVLQPYFGLRTTREV